MYNCLPDLIRPGSNRLQFRIWSVRSPTNHANQITVQLEDIQFVKFFREDTDKDIDIVNADENEDNNDADVSIDNNIDNDDRDSNEGTGRSIDTVTVLGDDTDTDNNW